MAGELSIGESCVAADYRHVSEASRDEAETLLFAASILSVIGNGVSVRLQEEVFSSILDAPTSPSHPSGVNLLNRLEKAEKLLNSLGARATNIATGAGETAQQIESRGLPVASE